MAEPKKKKIVSAESGEVVTSVPKKPQVVQAAPVGNATGLRVGAIVLWVLAFVFEILAICILFGKIQWTFMPQLYQLILFIVLDMACVIIGSQLWKKANHIKPASEKNPTLFWLWNNMGVIVACLAFVPFIILLLTNTNVDKKTKTIATIAAVIALLIAGGTSVDYNPVSAEQQQAAMEAISESVFWSPFGKVYHTYVVLDETGEVVECCPHLNRSEQLTTGTVEEAIAAGRTRLCSYCAKHDAITGVATDNVDVSDYVPEDVVETVEDAVETAETEADEAA